MSIEKAIEMIQNLRNAELETARIFSEQDKVEKNMYLISKGKADYLEQILHEIKPKTYPCMHPKMWQDVSEGQLYCTGCNQNL